MIIDIGVIDVGTQRPRRRYCPLDQRFIIHTRPRRLHVTEPIGKQELAVRSPDICRRALWIIIREVVAGSQKYTTAICGVLLAFLVIAELIASDSGSTVSDFA